MSDPKSNDKPAATPDQLVSGISAADELSDQEIEGVAGGGPFKGHGKGPRGIDDYLPVTSIRPPTVT